MTAYNRLTATFARIATLNEAASVLSWDAAAMMPDGGADARGEQMAILAGLSHELLTAPQLAEDFAQAESPNDAWHATNFALMRDAHKRATSLPQDLVEASSRANSKCETIWRTARPASDFAAVREALVEVVNLTRQSAVILGEALGTSPYDALLSGYQRGITAAELAPVFANYEKFLATALPQAEAKQRANPAPRLPPGPYPQEVQEKICRRLSEAAGLDYHHARLDRSAHPFCGGTPTDVRITNRYDENDFCAALMGVLHETGHGIYEQNLPPNFRRQPVGEAAGMAAHESQSLIIEMQTVRSDAYLTYLAPLLAAAFDKPITAAALKSRLRHVERSFIRVEADEMTYPAHVILRFRLEQALISGDLAVADLPGAWNEGFSKLLGITPPDDRRGCLQDIHWHAGLIGYFPTYTLGAMGAAQLMAAARRAITTLDASFAQGDLSPLKAWLNQNIHSHGASLGFNELLRRATGEALNPTAFEAHLTARYL
ncbi:MAG: carboxypeptidase M32 [Acidocella sp. 20-57-95]|nr:MAG: carboxypeptidase M32 [Acidocella sp. 20-57-95]OYV62458.1 MAG: carboxypeptidase M32 [Acidocella sp. 21-58-7]HQT64091.1 carboxypeptidase M32 [Acidocella sp.]HQU03692.1 carboxypeptidase M32 [Acidocella sp.]